MVSSTLALSAYQNKDGTIVAKADFELDGVSSEREETFVIGIYGRMTEADEWIQLATLEETIKLKPNEANTPKLSAAFSDGCGVSYNAQTGSRQPPTQRLNAP